MRIISIFFSLILVSSTVLCSGDTNSVSPDEQLEEYDEIGEKTGGIGEIDNNNPQRNNLTTTVKDWYVVRQGSCGEKVKYAIRSDRHLSIYGEGKMYEYSSSSTVPWGTSIIETAGIGSGVTSIGSYAFCGLSDLTSIEIPDSITSIGYHAFYGCSKLRFDYQNGVGYLGTKNNAHHAVIQANRMRLSSGGTRCSLSSSTINISDGTVVIAAEAFYDCDEPLTSINIPDSVISIGAEAFYSCSALTSINIPDSVTSIGDRAFTACNKVRYNSDGQGGKYLGNDNNPHYALIQGGSSVSYYTINSDTVFICSRAFWHNSKLKSVTIPNSVTSIGVYAFDGCSKLNSVTIGGSVTSIGDYAFQDCSELTSIHIPNSVTSIGNSAFRNCSGLKSIDIPDSVTYIGGSAFYYCRGCTSITIGGSVTRIGGWAFKCCYKLTSINIPGSVTYIGDEAFRYCTELASVCYSGKKNPCDYNTVFSDSPLQNVTVSESYEDSSFCGVSFTGRDSCFAESSSGGSQSSCSLSESSSGGPHSSSSLSESSSGGSQSSSSLSESSSGGSHSSGSLSESSSGGSHSSSSLSESNSGGSHSSSSLSESSSGGSQTPTVLSSAKFCACPSHWLKTIAMIFTAVLISFML